MIKLPSIILTVRLMKTTLFLIFITFLKSTFAQIENGMIAHFPFNNNLTDISVNSITATNNNSDFGPDRNNVPNHALVCNSSGFVSINDQSLKLELPIAFSYFVKFNSLDEVQFPIKTDNVFNNYFGVWMNTLPSGGMSISIGGGNGAANTSNQRYYTTDITPLTVGEWHHIVGIVRSYNDMDIYIDCVKSNGTYGGSGPNTVAYSSNGNSRIGCSIGSNISPNDQIMDGTMDQFVVWNRDLNSNEITLLCDKNNTLNASEIVVNQNEKSIVKIVDIIGREVQFQTNTILFYIYSDGSIEKFYVID